MFNRRKRSSSRHQPLSLNETQSAQSAASHAFRRSQPSSNSLSSAAAATALRNLTPPPTSVENVQTKRMIQRRASSQSQAGPLAARRSMSSDPQSLRRRNSSSSMTARTFREPSPHRPSTSSGPLDSTPVDVPPLPSLPSQYANRKLPHRRATSMQPQMRSPPTTPPRSAARGTSVDRVHEGPSGVHTAHQRLSSLSTVQEIERPTSRSSVNFSRPISPTSPTENKPMGFPAAVREEPLGEAAGTQPVQPVNTRPKMHTANSSESRKPIRSSGLPIGTAVAAAQAVIVQNTSPRAEPSQARVERIDTEPLDSSAPSRVDHTLPAVSDKSQHPPSRAISEQWSSTVIEKQEPADNTRSSQPREANHRRTSASPSVDHVEALTTPQPSPKADGGHTPQQPAHLRQTSSPGRSARFSKWLAVNPSEDQVHQPPPRSVSPVKSALKHPRGGSLSPDRRTGFAGHGVQQPSEMSDGASVASDEGSRNTVRRKPVKVSFDDEAEVVGVAASPPTAPEEYVTESPASKSKSRMSWLGFGRKNPDFGTGDDDFVEVMKPRPELPSFGSVRGNRDGGPKPPAPEPSDNESSTSSDEGSSAIRGVAVSGDPALASLPAHTQGSQPSQAQGIQSVEQLSVDGGPASVQQELSSGTAMNAVAGGVLSEQQPYAGVDSQMTVPSIAVEPATPSLEERTSFDTTRSSMERYRTIPGGFPASDPNRNLKSVAEGSNAQPVASPVQRSGSVEGEEESDDSVYDDAAEDIDGDGFGSINAIVDSRSIPRSSAPLATISENAETTPKAPVRAAAVDAQSQDVTDQAGRDARSVTPTNALIIPQMDDSPSSDQPRSGAVSPPVPVKSAARVSQTPNGVMQLETKKQRRTASVDAYAPPSPQSSRQSKANGDATTKSKTWPASLGPAFQMTRHYAFPNPLRRTTSNGSDSDSSFKRSTPSPRGDVLTMRRTMRASSTFAALPSSVDRPESPNDRRPFSSGSGTGTIRTTMRNQGGGNERHSFFASKKAQAARNRFSKGPKARRGSRFADSDDEDDEGRPQAFRSRFADSSDEDEPGSSTLRPVRGIPRRQDADDGDSTELEDSSEEDRQPVTRPVVSPPVTITPPTSRGRDAQPNMSGMAAVARQRGMTQRELEEFLMQSPRSRKSGILARLGIKKPKNMDNRVRKADYESPSRRDTPLERSRFERKQLREEDYEPSGSPKLRKKNKRFTIAGDAWPLRSAPAETHHAPTDEVQSAPSSPVREPPGPSNGAARNGGILTNGESNVPGKESQAGPDFNDAGSDITNTTNNEVGHSARDVVIAGSGRKKGRFSLLRKAFGRKT